MIGVSEKSVGGPALSNGGWLSVLPHGQPAQIYIPAFCGILNADLIGAPVSRPGAFQEILTNEPGLETGAPVHGRTSPGIRTGIPLVPSSQRGWATTTGGCCPAPLAGWDKWDTNANARGSPSMNRSAGLQTRLVGKNLLERAG